MKMSELIKPEDEMKEISESEQKIMNNSTISTKLSTDNLICKSPQESPASSVKSLHKCEVAMDKKEGVKFCAVFYLGALQAICGFLMIVFGVLVMVNEANLSQIGGGLWGGCLAVATGTAGVLAGGGRWCPLKNTPQKIAHTTFLALSLISIAISQLVLVLAATGLARDISKAQDMTEDPHYPTTERPPSDNLPPNYPAILTNVALLLVAAAECIFATISAYRSARTLCQCFQTEEDMLDYRENYKNALVNSWLGKHTAAQPLYVIAAPPSTLSAGSKNSGSFQIAPIYTMPPPMLPPPTMVRYPLIPAPLGTVPSPVIYPHPKEMMLNKRQRKQIKHLPKYKEINRDKRSRSKSREKVITTEDVAKTYTGLDRTIAEEFIEICDSRNMSLRSNESSCQSSCLSSACHCQHPCSGCASTCTNSSHNV